MCLMEDSAVRLILPPRLTSVSVEKWTQKAAIRATVQRLAPTSSSDARLPVHAPLVVTAATPLDPDTSEATGQLANVLRTNVPGENLARYSAKVRLAIPCSVLS